MTQSQQGTLEDLSGPKQHEDLYISGLRILGPEGIKNETCLKISDGVIAQILAQPPKNQPSIDGKGFLVMPGLINSHCHAAMSFFRGYHPDANDTVSDIFFRLESQLNQDLVRQFSYNYIYDGLRSGVTCFNDHFYFSLGTAEACAQLGVRARIAETTLDREGPFKSKIEDIAKIIDQWNFPSTVVPSIGPHATDTVSPKLLKQCAELAKAHGLPIHMHMAQRQKEFDFAVKNFGKSPVAHALEMGVLGPRNQAVHLIHVNEDDKKILADSASLISLCPSSQVLFETLSPMIADLDKSAFNFALATDCAGSNDGHSLLGEGKIAALFYKDRTGRKLNPKKTHEQITTKAAESMFGNMSLGHISEGALADLVFLNLNPDCFPLDRVYDHLILSGLERHIKHVMIDGKWVLWNTEPTNMSTNDIIREFNQAYSQLKWN